MHLNTGRIRCSYRRWGHWVLAAGMLALGPRVHASTVPPTLTLDGSVIVSVSDADGQGIMFDLRALGDSDVYLDLGNLNVTFQDVSLTAEQGGVTLHGGEVSDLWPHVVPNAQTVSDTEVVSVLGDVLIQPDAAWGGATFSLLAGGDMHVYGGDLIASGNVSITASDVTITAPGSSDIIIDAGAGGGGSIGGDITIGGGSVIDAGAGGDITLVGGDITLVPVPGAAWLFGAALLSLAGYARRRRTA